ncbi:MAG: aminodeoxychorismate/anthranilate synthase component II [Legionellaceae bacterium]|nr:aminodeoxychorismate/anthranilate synthase component II [Legionellaceae bacterium]
MSDYGWLIAHQAVSVPEVPAFVSQADKHVVLVDHYDSFTQLIKSYFEKHHIQVSVLQFDDVALQKLETLAPTHVVFSPGPGRPSQITQRIILEHYKTYPMLGVCLGHQCLIKAFGGKIVQAPEVCHGKQFHIYHTDEGLFHGIPQGFLATRYHSLTVAADCVPSDWVVTAWTNDTRGRKVVMGVQHQAYPLFGVQYHPEAILTEYGNPIFEQFVLLSQT